MLNAICMPCAEATCLLLAAGDSPTGSETACGTCMKLVRKLTANAVASAGSSRRFSVRVENEKAWRGMASLESCSLKESRSNCTPAVHASSGSITKIH